MTSVQWKAPASSAPTLETTVTTAGACLGSRQRSALAEQQQLVGQPTGVRVANNCAGDPTVSVDATGNAVPFRSSLL